jgi:hypothetical protein
MGHIKGKYILHAVQVFYYSHKELCPGVLLLAQRTVSRCSTTRTTNWSRCSTTRTTNCVQVFYYSHKELCPGVLLLAQGTGPGVLLLAQGTGPGVLLLAQGIVSRCSATRTMNSWIRIEMGV